MRLSREACICFFWFSQLLTFNSGRWCNNAIKAASVNLGERAQLQLQKIFLSVWLKGIAISACYRTEKEEHKKLRLNILTLEIKIVILKYLDKFQFKWLLRYILTIFLNGEYFN